MRLVAAVGGCFLPSLVRGILGDSDGFECGFKEKEEEKEEEEEGEDDEMRRSRYD